MVNKLYLETHRGQGMLSPPETAPETTQRSDPGEPGRARGPGDEEAAAAVPWDQPCFHMQPPGTAPLIGSLGWKARSAQKHTLLGQLWPAWGRRRRRTTTKKKKDLRMCLLVMSRLWPGPGAAMWPSSSEAFRHASHQKLRAPTGLGTPPWSCSRMCGTSLLTSRII